MNDSILTGTKKILGIEEDYTVFDFDIMMHINSAFATLAQLGIGPENGFMIESKSDTWDDFLGDDVNLNPVKTYVYLKVRLVFDPPATSYGIAAMEKQIDQAEWRLSTYREGLSWVPPVESVDRLSCEPIEPVW